MDEYQSSRNNPLIHDLEKTFRQRATERKYELAEIAMRKLLDVPGQQDEVYYYTPAEFYEEWGDAEAAKSPAIAEICYQQAIHHRYRTAIFATGSGDGAVIMYHIKRIQRKLKQLQMTN
jgi:hypothetical protein